MTIPLKSDTNLTSVTTFHPNEKNKKLQRLLKMFNKLIRINDNTIRSRRNSNMLNDNDGNLFNVRDKSKFYGRPIGDTFNKKPNRNLKKKEKALNILKTTYQTFDNYCANTTLHGLRYVGDAHLTIFERIFWLVAFTSAVSFAFYFITNIYDKYNNSPVIISFSPVAASISSIPFPAVTVCNLNQVLKSQAQIILKDGSEIEKKLLDDYCNSNISFPNSTINSDEELTNWSVVNKFITKITQSCSDLLKSCQWRQIEIDCNQLFVNYFTDDGLCCTFNRLPNSLIFRNLKEVEEELINSTFIVEDWTPEKGFTSSDVQMNSTPFRAVGPGSHQGLTIVVDAAVNEYFCSSTSSSGFKVLLSNPIETPKMADYGFLISPGVEARVVIEPSINDATTTLESIDISKRQCFFSNERHLKYYRTYTERNCHLECQSNYTLDRCGCIPYFLPRNKKTKICDKQQDACSNEAKMLMETSTPRLNCNCLPGCFEIAYFKSASLGQLSNKFKVRENILGKEDINYFARNMAVLHFFYEKGQFTKHTKSEIYGFTEFLSNTGGLLGLFLGFSFLSAVELGYYFSLKLLCNFTQYKKKSKAKQDLVYPFTK